jgi:hypothetical protein
MSVLGVPAFARVTLPAPAGKRRPALGAQRSTS